MRLLITLIINLFFIYSASAVEKEKAYFAGGCFWCVEESFEKLKGVEKVISGYSGGTTENPTYKEVTYGNTGHFEVVEIIYNKEIISYVRLLKNFWINIDPFDANGQFCDKGYSYRSVAFYQNQNERKLISSSINFLSF
jgi:peptide-methionine (S)-S-oxide reductase